MGTQSGLRKTNRGRRRSPGGATCKFANPVSISSDNSHSFFVLFFANLVSISSDISSLFFSVLTVVPTRQEQLLSGRIARAKTEDPNHDPAGRGPGIQIYHYKDPGSLPLKHIFFCII